MNNKDIYTAIQMLDTDRTDYQVTLILSALLNYCQELERRLELSEKDNPK